MALFCQQELFQHAPIRLFLLFFKSVQLDCRKGEQTVLKISLLTSSDLLTNNVVFGKCKSLNFMSWVLHKAVTRNKNNCPVKVMIYLDDILAINIRTVFRYTKDITSLSFRVTNNIVAVQNFPYGEVLWTLSSFHREKAVAQTSDPGSLNSHTYMGTRHLHVEHKV